ncbi:type II toxin-antitoxin system RelE/ParE family toxin [Lichenicoccus sp.]|uniref:type II toxin-antitoxin system RelE/ParE family toxin n=1 Tax=Lichenicoccus sp. TaxID=2781899 RepID=UPI003D0E03EC
MLVRLTPGAEADLEAIGDYIAQDNPLRAATFVAEIRHKYNSLVDMPLGFPLIPRYEHRGVRHRVHGSYQIFYRTVGNPVARVDILHIIHAARNYAAILF